MTSTAAVVGGSVGSGELARIGELIRTQDNRITADPLFAVQERVRDYGYEDGDGYEWRNADGDWELAGPDLRLVLDRKADEREETGGWVRYYYRDRWEFVTACFTEQGCKDFIEAYRHRLKEPRIYAYSAHGNAE